MKRFWISIFLAGCVALSGAGCKRWRHQTVAQPAGPQIPTTAQPKLQTMKLWIGSQEMIAELALTPLQEQTGMMFRTNMAENEGMIFPFLHPLRASFWMKNTVLPLSAAYIAPNGTVLEIHDLKPLDTNAVVAATDNIEFVLETKQGWFERNHIGVGTVVSTERGPLHSVFMVE
jgi:uncharacterized membrane protein (UPF0127 family)